jgi:FAD/FMN-containing dehydrogenase
VKNAVSPGLVSDLRAAVGCRVITPGEPDYDEARTVFMGGFDRRPAAIVRPTGAADVAKVIGFAHVRAAYPKRTWDRLAAVKERYDPANVFRCNHNVPPRRAGVQETAVPAMYSWG